MNDAWLVIAMHVAADDAISNVFVVKVRVANAHLLAAYHAPQHRKRSSRDKTLKSPQVNPVAPFPHPPSH